MSTWASELTAVKVRARWDAFEECSEVFIDSVVKSVIDQIFNEYGLDLNADPALTITSIFPSKKGALKNADGDYSVMRIGHWTAITKVEQAAIPDIGKTPDWKSITSGIVLEQFDTIPYPFYEIRPRFIYQTYLSKNLQWRVTGNYGFSTNPDLPDDLAEIFFAALTAAQQWDENGGRFFSRVEDMSSKVHITDKGINAADFTRSAILHSPLYVNILDNYRINKTYPS